MPLQLKSKMEVAVLENEGNIPRPKMKPEHIFLYFKTNIEKRENTSEGARRYLARVGWKLVQNIYDKATKQVRAARSKTAVKHL